jgi:hypothetical protein
VETENHGGGWVFDCKCLDAVPSQSDAENSGDGKP